MTGATNNLMGATRARASALVKPVTGASVDLLRPQALARRSSSRWQLERARRLHCICQGVAAALQRGETHHAAISRAARRWHGKSYRCEPARKWKLSAHSLRAHFAAWRKSPTPSAFSLGYRTRPAPDTEALAASLRAACIAPACTSLASAIRSVQSGHPGHSERNLRRLLDARTRRVLRTIHAARRAVLLSERRLR